MYIFDYWIYAHENDHNLSDGINVNDHLWEKHEDIFRTIEFKFSLNLWMETNLRDLV